MNEHSVNTRDGRMLHVQEDGDRRGKPVFALHGTPGSAMLYGAHVNDAAKRGIRLISYDRSGYGESSRHRGRKVADAAKDVEVIADSLGLERFAVWGISGGGPHTLACAALLPKRVVAAASLASPAPYGAPGLDWLNGQGEDNVNEFNAALVGSDKLARFLEPQREMVMKATPQEMVEGWESLIPPVDREAMLGKLGPFLVSNMKAGLRSGYDGWQDDDLAFVSDWGFELSDISVPLVLWQGRHDKMVPYSHGEWLAGHINRVEAHLTPEDGHLTLFDRRVPEAHAWLMKHF